MPRRAGTWNHNTYHHAGLLRLVPAAVARALDVGCGDGTFAAKLASRCRLVEALDADAQQVAATRARCRGLGNVRAYQADFLKADLPASAFDLVTGLAAFHHMPFDDALRSAIRILRPGGRLLLLGVWTDTESASDMVLNLVSTGHNLGLRALRGPDEMSSPQTMPTMSLLEVRQVVHSRLPGATIRRGSLWRYILTWDKPS